MAEESEDLPAKQKVAILMIALGQETTAEVMKYLTDFEVEQIAQSISELEVVTTEQEDEVLEEREPEEEAPEDKELEEEALEERELEDEGLEDQELGDENLAEDILKTDCRSCGFEIEVPASPDEYPYIVQCPDCGARGRMRTPPEVVADE